MFEWAINVRDLVTVQQNRSEVGISINIQVTDECKVAVMSWTQEALLNAYMLMLLANSRLWL